MIIIEWKDSVLNKYVGLEIMESCSSEFSLDGFGQYKLISKWFEVTTGVLFWICMCLSDYMSPNF